MTSTLRRFTHRNALAVLVTLGAGSSAGFVDAQCTCTPASPAPNEIAICSGMTYDLDGDGSMSGLDLMLFLEDVKPCNSHLDWSTEAASIESYAAIANKYREMLLTETTYSVLLTDGTSETGTPCSTDGEIDDGFADFIYSEYGYFPTTDQLAELTADPNPIDCQEPEDNGGGRDWPLICSEAVVPGESSPCVTPEFPREDDDETGGPIICATEDPEDCDIPADEDIPWDNPFDPNVPNDLPPCAPGDDCGNNFPMADDMPDEDSDVPAQPDDDDETTDDDEDTKSKTPCLDAQAGNSTTSSSPVLLGYGDKVETWTDLRVRVSGPDFAVKRFYTSDPDAGFGGIVGNNQWMNTFEVLQEQGSSLRLIGENPRGATRFDLNSPVYEEFGAGIRTVTSGDAVAGGAAVAEDAGSLDLPVWNMDIPGIGTQQYYRESKDSSEWDVGVLEGLIRSRKDEYGNEQRFVYRVVGTNLGAGAPRLHAVYLNPSSDLSSYEAKVVFSYYLHIHDTPFSHPKDAYYSAIDGMLSYIKVFRQASGGGVELVETVSYTYAGDSGFSDDVGTSKDLIFVKREVLTTDSDIADGGSSGETSYAPPDLGGVDGFDTYRPLITHYRYHNSTTPSGGDGTAAGADGRAGQLKLVINPEQYEYGTALAFNNGEGRALTQLLGMAQVVTKDDDETYFREGTTKVSIMDMAAKVINYESAASGRVTEQFLQADCGCDGSASGIKQTFTYTGDIKTNDWATVVLKETGFSGTAFDVPYRSMIYDFEERPSATDDVPYLSTFTVRDDRVGDGREWSTHYEYDSDGRVTEKWMPSAITSRTAGSGMTAPSLTTGGAGVGLAWTYTYDSNNMRTETYAQEGVGTGSPARHLVKHVTYLTTGSRYTLPDVVSRVRIDGQTSFGSIAANDLEVIDYDYGFVTGTDQAIAWMTESVEAELASENGPTGTGNTYTTTTLHDPQGRPQWKQLPDGSVMGFEYDDDTGKINKLTENVYSINFSWTNTSSSPVTTSGWGSSTDDEIETKLAYDSRGLMTDYTYPGGKTHRVYREYRRIDIGSALLRNTPYFRKTVLPHKLTTSRNYQSPFATGSTNEVAVAFDGPMKIKYISAGGESLHAWRQQLSGTATFPPAAEDASVGIDALATGIWNLETRFVHSLSGREEEMQVRYDDPDDSAETYVTEMRYDEMGRLKDFVAPDDTVTRFAKRDAYDRPEEVQVGVDGGTYDTVRKLHYDDPNTDATPESGVGDGNLSWQVEIVSDTESRATYIGYDFRNRPTSSVTPAGPHVVVTYDNLSRPTSAALLNESARTANTVVLSSAESFRGSLFEVDYSQRGLPYRYRTDWKPEDTAADYLITDVWRDEVGRTAAVRSPSGPVVKAEYDLLGRLVTRMYTDQAGTSYADVVNVADDIVVEQIDVGFEALTGLPNIVTTRRRLHDEISTSTGKLGSSTSVATFLGLMYDDARRLIRKINYGTNQADFASGSSVPTIPGSVPDWDTSGFADTLLSAFEYDEFGRLANQVDSEGTVTFYGYDNLFRTDIVVENFKDATIAYDNVTLNRWEAENIAQLGTSGDDAIGTDRVTSYYYDSVGRLDRTIAHLADDADTESIYETAYDYGVVTTGTLPSDFSSNALLRRVRYADESTGQAVAPGAGSVNDFSVRYAYNRAGQIISAIDQNGTTHVYDFDENGRLAEDAVTVGTGVDSLVDALQYDYDELGRLQFGRSLDGSTILNEYEFEYDGLSRITDFHQNVAQAVRDGMGALNTDTETVVNQYTTTSGTPGQSRMSGLKYPSGTNLLYSYGTAGTLNDDIDRLEFVLLAGFGSQIVTWNKYLGLDTPVQTILANIQKTMDLTVAYDGVSSADTYDSLDRFGRKTSHVWVDSVDFGAGTNTTDGLPTTPPVIGQVQTFDRVSNPLTRYDVRPGSAYAGRHVDFAYDGLHRLTGFTPGFDTDGDGQVESGERSAGMQVMTLDHLGNRVDVGVDADNDGTIQTDELEVRDHNGANELLEEEIVDGFFSTGTDYEYDKNGNVVRVKPKGAIFNFRHTYDAWNRLVSVDRIGGTFPPTTTEVSEYQYSAFHQQTDRTFDRTPNSGVSYERRQYYYTVDWRMIEEHLDDSYTWGAAFSADRTAEYFYGINGIDEACVKRIDGNNDGDYTDTTTDDSVWYMLSDVMGSVSAVLDSSGQLYERVVYDVHGNARHHFAGDVNGDGDFDASDEAVLTGLTLPVLITDANYDANLDMDMDGDIDTDDETIIAGMSARSALVGGAVSDPNGPDNEFGFAGYRYRAEINASLARHRHYSATLQRWLSRDPIGYSDGFNVYEYVRSSPTVFVDPTGLLAFAKGTSAGLPNPSTDPCGYSKANLGRKVANGEMSAEEAACRNSKICGDNAGSAEYFAAWLSGFGEGALDALTDPHLLLDGAGMVPVVGIVADGANAALYLYEGDYVNAGISGVAMVPGLGQGATLAKATGGAGFVAIVIGRRGKAFGGGTSAIDEALDGVDGAAKHLLEGGDTLASSQSGAREAARRAGGGEPLLENSGLPGEYPHYHVTDGYGRRVPGAGHSNFPPQNPR